MSVRTSVKVCPNCHLVMTMEYYDAVFKVQRDGQFIHITCPDCSVMLPSSFLSKGLLDVGEDLKKSVSGNTGLDRLLRKHWQQLLAVSNRLSELEGKFEVFVSE